MRRFLAWWAKLKFWYKELPSGSKETALTLTIIIGVAFAAYGCGRLSSIEAAREPVQIITPQNSTGPMEKIKPSQSPPLGTKAEHTAALLNATPTPVLTPADGRIIGVKSSRKYYFPWCATIQRLKEDNAIVFNSIDEAKKAGYTPAKNCKGLK